MEQIDIFGGEGRKGCEAATESGDEQQSYVGARELLLVEEANQNANDQTSQDIHSECAEGEVGLKIFGCHN